VPKAADRSSRRWRGAPRSSAAPAIFDARAHRVQAATAVADARLDVFEFLLARHERGVMFRALAPPCFDVDRTQRFLERAQLAGKTALALLQVRDVALQALDARAFDVAHARRLGRLAAEGVPRVLPFLHRLLGGAQRLAGLVALRLALVQERCTVFDFRAQLGQA
jgi:hypothetical protein